MSFSTAIAFSCRSFRARNNARCCWLSTVFTCTGRYRLTRIICAIPRASLRSDLVTCALRKALAWRVSIQITGRPARASPSNNHCDNGPASNPISSTCPPMALRARARSFGVVRNFQLSEDLTVFVNNTNGGLFYRYIQSGIVLHAASLSDACGCVTQTTYYHQLEAQLLPETEAGSRAQAEYPT